MGENLLNIFLRSLGFSFVTFVFTPLNFSVTSVAKFFQERFMPYAIQTQDKAGAAKVRADNRVAHIEYLTANKHLLLAAGALIDDDGTGGNGGILIVDTDDRKEAERFIAGDPFSRAGLFEKVTITRWRKAFFDKQRLI